MADEIPPDAYVMIIGAMKCGTTSLFDYLKHHPAICRARDKEPEFFSEHQAHGLTVDSYSDLWAFDASRHRYALEASTGYSKYPVERHVPQRIAEYGLDPRFIYLVRNPFDRIESQFDYWRVNDPALTITDERLIRYSDYYLQLKQYQPYFPRENVLILDFDDLCRDPAQVLTRVYRFLDLPGAYFPEAYKPRNVTRPRSFGKSMKRLWKSVMRGSPGEGRKPAPVQRRRLTPEERQSVHDELKDNMARLRDEYGVDVSKWGFEA